MKKSNFLFVILFLFSSIAFCQISANFSTYTFYKDKNIQEIGDLSKKTIVIELYDYSKGEIKKFKKKGTYDKAMKDLAASNEKFVSIIKENLDVSNKIKTNKDVSEDIYTKSEDYIAIRIRNLTEQRQKRNTTYRFSYSALELKCGKKYLVMYSNTGSSFSDLELTTALNYMKECLSAAKEGVEGKEFQPYVLKRTPELKTKTLLIPSGATKMTEEEIKEVYPYPFQLVSSAEIKEKVDAKNAEFAYYWPQHENASCGKGFHHIIYSCEDQSLLAILEADSFKFGNHGGNSATFFEIFDAGTGNVYLSKVLRKKDLEEIAAFAKINP